MPDLTHRDKLRALIAAKESAAAALAHATRSASNAEKIVGEAIAQFRSFDKLDDEITAYRAALIDAWSASGSDDRPSPSLELSAELTARTQKRQEAYSTLLAAKAAQAALDEKAAKASAAFAAADSAVKAAADAVMMIDADRAADGLEKAQAFVNALRFRLRAYLRIQRPAAIGYAPLSRSPRLRDLAEYPREPFTSAAINPEGDELAVWQEYHQRLLADPDAVLDRD